MNGTPFVHLFIHVSQWDDSRYDPATTANTTHYHEISIHRHRSSIPTGAFVLFRQCICWNLWSNQKVALSVLNKHYTGRCLSIGMCVQIMMWTGNCIKNGMIVICMDIFCTSQVPFFISLKCTSAFWNCKFNKSFSQNNQYFSLVLFMKDMSLSPSSQKSQCGQACEFLDHKNREICKVQKGGKPCRKKCIWNINIHANVFTAIRFMWLIQLCYMIM